MSRSTLSTHVLDATLGLPARNVVVRLLVWQSDCYIPLDQQVTDQDGRIRFEDVKLLEGLYQIVFEVRAYFEAQGQTGFYPRVAIDFEVTDIRHYHVPLLLSPYAYSTYRGS